MPYKNPTPEQLKRLQDKNGERQSRFKARQKAIAIVESGTPQEVKDNISTWLFQMGATIKKGDARQMWLNYVKYKEVCAITNEPTMPLTVFMVMGLTPDEVRAILQGKLFAQNKEVQEVVRKIVMFVLADVEQAHLQGDISNTTLIWYQKNFAGMSDFPEQTPIEIQDTDTITPEQIADKYKHILD